MRAATLCLLLLAIPATGDVAADALEPPDSSRYLRWGPLRVRPGFQLTNLGYDDNIFATADNKVGDYVVTLAPRLNGLVFFGNVGFLEFTEQPEYTLYVDNDDQNYFNNRFRSRLTIPFSRLGLFSDVVLEQVRERPQDQEDIRPERNERRLALGMILDLGWRTEIELAYEVSDWRYDDPDFSSNGQSISELLDRDQSIWRLNGGYRIRGRTRLTLDAETAEIDFDEPFIVGNMETDKDSDAWRGYLGAEFDEGGALSGSFRLGWTEIDVADPSLRDFSDYVGDAELAYRLNSRTRIELEVERRPDFAVYRDQTYLLNTNYGLRAIRYLNRTVGIEAGAQSGKLEFPEETGGVFRRDDVTGYDGGVRLRLRETSIGRRVEYRIRVARIERDSNISGRDREQTRLAIDVLLGY